MVKTNRGAGPRKKKEDPLVQCDQCSRWAYLDETEFGDVEAANAAAWFDCKACTEVKALRLRLQTTESKVEELRVLVKRLSVQGVCERTRSLGEASKGDGAAVTHGGPVEVADLHTGPAVSKGPEVEGVEAPAQARETEENGAPEKAQGGATWLSDTDGSNLHLQHPNVEAVEVQQQSRESGGDPQSGHQGTALLQHSGLATMNRSGASQSVTGDSVAEDMDTLKTGAGAEVPQMSTVALPPVSEQATVQPAVVKATPKGAIRRLDGSRENNDGEPHVDMVEQRVRLDYRIGKVTPSEEAAEKVLIVGDTNASRITRALQRQLGGSGKRNVHWYRVQRAQEEDIEAFCSRYQEDPDKKLQCVVLHMGLTDVLEGTQPEGVVEVIRKTLVPHTHHLFICSVPEISTRGKETHAQIVLLNSLLRRLCDSLNVTFLDLSICTQGKDHLARDGIHFLAKTARTVAGVVAQAVSPFLGVRKVANTGRDRRKKTPTRHRTSPRIFRRSHQRESHMEDATAHGGRTGPRGPSMPVRSEEPCNNVELREPRQGTGGGVHSIPGHQPQGAPTWPQLGLWNGRPHHPAPVVLAPGQHPMEPSFPARLPPVVIHRPPFPPDVHPAPQMAVDMRLFHMVGDFVRHHLTRDWCQRA